MISPHTKTALFLGTTTSFFVLAQTALAATPCYTMLAPIGTFTATGCYTLKEYLNGIFETVIGIAGILAVVMIVICGIRLMSTPSVSGRSEAKECIYNALFGVLIAIGSWLLLNTINPQLLKNDAAIGVQTSPLSGVAENTPIDAPMPAQPSYPSGFYYRYKGEDGKIKNSPVYNSIEYCNAAQKGQADGGVEITAGPAGIIGCFNLPKSAAPVSSGEDATRRLICGNDSCVPNAKTPNNSNSNVYINKPPCVPYDADFHLCQVGTGTNVGGLDSTTVQSIKDLAAACNCKVVITGGTENGHKSHGSNIPVFDLSRTASLYTFVKNNAEVKDNPSFCNYNTDGTVSTCFKKWLYAGYWFTDESGGSADPHWHVCKDGTIAPPGKPVGLYINACTKK